VDNRRPSGRRHDASPVEVATGVATRGAVLRPWKTASARGEGIRDADTAERRITRAVRAVDDVAGPTRGTSRAFGSALGLVRYFRARALAGGLQDLPAGVECGKGHFPLRPRDRATCGMDETGTTRGGPAGAQAPAPAPARGFVMQVVASTREPAGAVAEAPMRPGPLRRPRWRMRDAGPTPTCVAARALGTPRRRRLRWRQSAWLLVLVPGST
jgi:hypothetical protein